MDQKNVRTPLPVCQAKQGSKYCSTYCEGEAKTADIICNCGHASCVQT